MSGDVQPRKRKDKRKKKDELNVEEPRGTSAVFGDGDVFMHSHHEHGTGGHWCAKVIFFSLLAVLITLIGLIILENRGLSELEANSIESRYSGVLDGWLEDAADDDHHDAHTLELKHHDDDDDHGQNEHSNEVDQTDDEQEDHDEEDLSTNEDEDNNENSEESDEKDDQGDEDDEEPADEESREQDFDDDEPSNEESQEQDIDNDEDEEDDAESYELGRDNDDKEQDDEANEDSSEDFYKNDNTYVEANGGIDDEDNNDDDTMLENNDRVRAENDDEDEDEQEESEEEIEVEKIEKEASDEEPISVDLPSLPEEDSQEDDQDDGNDDNDSKNDEEIENQGDAADEDEEFLENDIDDDIEPEVVEHITAPAGKPFLEVEDEDTSVEQSPDTLAEEEEYEKQQEEMRLEEEGASHMWLKLSIGAALLVATHAVLRRATAPRDVADSEEQDVPDEPTAVDRRMTLIPEQLAHPVPPKITQEIRQPVVERESIRNIPTITKSAPTPKQESEDEEIETIEPEEEITIESKEEEKEMYSDEEEIIDEEEVEEVIVPKKEIPKSTAPIVPKPEPEPEEVEDEEVPDDVEIIDDEQIEEELEEEDEEEISDVDDTELLSRLEAKYGRLPEPERPGPKNKDGGNSYLDDWPGEPSDSYWRDQLDQAEQEMRQSRLAPAPRACLHCRVLDDSNILVLVDICEGLLEVLRARVCVSVLCTNVEGSWMSAERRASAEKLRDSARAKHIIASALDGAAEENRDNKLLSRAIAAYLDLLKMNESLPNKKLLEIALRTIDRMKFRGAYISTEPVYKILIRRFPEEPGHRNNLTIAYLMANRADLAEGLLKETLQRWPSDRIALAHYGFVLKTLHNKYEDSIKLFEKALEGDIGSANEPRFYYHLGDAYLLLGKFAEAHEVHKRGAKLGHFLSPAQRSLYNVQRLKSKPWWNVEQTPYLTLARSLEKSWKDILKEGQAAQTLYEKEKEGLKERGEWSQLDLFLQGREVPGRCLRAPVTCSIVKSQAEACRRGQVKFSLMEAGTHVRPHVGPTNCRLRMHLGLSNTKNTFLRVDQETRSWREGKVLLFDDSFEHEVWHNGTGKRLVLIVDVWHPDLTPREKLTLPAI